MTIDLLLLSMQLMDQSWLCHLTNQLDQKTRGGRQVQRSLCVRVSVREERKRGERERERSSEEQWVQLKKEAALVKEWSEPASRKQMGERIPINSSVQVCCMQLLLAQVRQKRDAIHNNGHISFLPLFSLFLSLSCDPLPFSRWYSLLRSGKWWAWLSCSCFYWLGWNVSTSVSLALFVSSSGWLSQFSRQPVSSGFFLQVCVCLCIRVYTSFKRMHLSTVWVW